MATIIPVRLARVSAVESPSAEELGTLVRAVATRADRAAFARLFTHFAPRLKAFLVRGGASPELAEDLAQEAMVALWQKAHAFDAQRASVATWLYTIARNLWVDHCRRQQHPAAQPDAAAWLADLPEVGFDSLAADALLATQRQLQVGDALARLPGEQAMALKLAYFDDASHSQIAAALSIPLGTVKSRVRLGLATLKKVLNGEEL